MRTKLVLTTIVLALLVLPATLRAGGSVGISFGVFYSSLGSHGEWISVGAGDYAWHPAGVDVGWRPYTAGHWVWTDDGWFWVSDEPWGWATYHYGRWYYDDFYGWLWVPGYEWAPAWVEWRYGGGCVGWAPLCPYAVYRPGFGIYYRHRWETPHSYWSFVDSRYIGDADVHRYVYRPEENPRLIGRTRTGGNVRVESGRIVTRGPDRAYVERTGKVTIPRAEMVDVGSRDNARVLRSGGTERIEVYRPRVERGAAGATAERPERVRETTRTPSVDMKTTDLGIRREGRQAGAAVRQPRTNSPQGNAATPAQKPERARRVDQTPRQPQPESGRAPERAKSGERQRGERRYEQVPAQPRGGAVERSSRDQSRVAPRHEGRPQYGSRAQQPQRSARPAATSREGGRGGERRSR